MTKNELPLVGKSLLSKFPDIHKIAIQVYINGSKNKAGAMGSGILIKHAN